MVNHFARIGLAPSPWLDAEKLKERFLELSATAHPDKAAAAAKAGAEQQFRELNEAFNVLRNSRARLLHLLEICGVAKQEHVQSVPAAALEFFAEIAAVTKEADVLIKEKAAASSPMLKVQLMEKGLERIETMQGLQEKLRRKISEIEERLKRAGQEWRQPPKPEALLMLAESAAALGFFEKWNAQLQERIGTLTF